MGLRLRKGQQLRPLHPALAEREWGLRGDCVGTVLCAYRVSIDRSDRVDVIFTSGVTIWGAPAAEFAIVGEANHAG